MSEQSQEVLDGIKEFEEFTKQKKLRLIRDVFDKGEKEKWEVVLPPLVKDRVNNYVGRYKWRTGTVKGPCHLTDTEIALRLAQEYLTEYIYSDYGSPIFKNEIGELLSNELVIYKFNQALKDELRRIKTLEVEA